MILILSNKWDLSVDFVVAELHELRRPFLRINTEDLAKGNATVHLPSFGVRLSKAGTIHSMGNVSVIWNRRPGKPYDDLDPSQRPSEATQRFVNDQWYSWLESLQLLEGVAWINHPQVNDRMESKIRQLWLADRIGFRIPKTLVTNDYAEAHVAFSGHPNGVIVKALYGPLIEEPDQDYFIFTHHLESLTPSDAGQLRLAPVIFQEALLPKVDYRVTVVGDEVFPVRIDYDAKQQPAIDWRTVEDGISFTPHVLPDRLVDLCRTYVRENGLLFGAIDLVEYQGEFVFIEINPNGEWGWLQKPHNVPIASALCKLMISLDRGDGP